MLENGYIKIYRKFTDWEWYQDLNTKILFLHLLLTVNYEDKNWQGIVVKRGQRVASYQILAAELSLSIKKIRGAIEHLKATGEVAHTTTSKYGLFTVINYEKYQDRADTTAVKGQPKGQSKGNNERKIKNIENIYSKYSPSELENSDSKKFEIDSVEYISSKYLRDRILRRSPNARVPKTEEELQKWCKHINFIIRIDKRSKDELSAVLKFATTDEFWSSNILSTAKLREKFDMLLLKSQFKKETQIDKTSEYPDLQ